MVGAGAGAGGAGGAASIAAQVAGGGAPSGQDFILQLATTRRMLFNILEKHDAVPDKVRCSSVYVKYIGILIRRVLTGIIREEYATLISSFNMHNFCFLHLECIVGQEKPKKCAE